MQISKATRTELERAACEGPVVRLHWDATDAGREGVHRVLTRSGATWSVRHQGYMFADLFPFGQAADLVRLIIDRRHAVNRPDRGMVSCPQSIAETLWGLNLPSDLNGWRVLEPSAGHGVLPPKAQPGDAPSTATRLTPTALRTSPAQASPAT